MTSPLMRLFARPSLSLSLATFLLLCGCGRPDGSASPGDGCASGTPCAHADAPARRASVNYATLKASDPVVTVDGVALTKGQLEDECDIQTALAALANRKFTVENANKLKDRLRQTAVRRFLLRRAVLKEADRRQIAVSDDELEAFRKTFASRVGRKARAFTYAQITNRLSAAQAASLDADLRQDCRYQKAHSILRDESRVSVTPQEAEKRFARIRDYNARAEAAEREAYAAATNAWRRLAGGAAFEDVAAELDGQDSRIVSDMEWGTFQLPFFADDPALREALSRMGPGEFTPPLPGDNGLLLVLVQEKLPPSSPADAGGDYYRLARILFRLPETFELTDAERLRKDLERELTDEKLNTTLLRLQANMTVEHPMGVVVFRPISTATKGNN